jgi:hypothetical protein
MLWQSGQLVANDADVKEVVRMDYANDSAAQTKLNGLRR